MEISEAEVGVDHCGADLNVVEDGHVVGKLVDAGNPRSQRNAVPPRKWRRETRGLDGGRRDWGFRIWRGQLGVFMLGSCFDEERPRVRTKTEGGPDIPITSVLTQNHRVCIHCEGWVFSEPEDSVRACNFLKRLRPRDEDRNVDYIS